MSKVSENMSNSIPPTGPPQVPAPSPGEGNPSVSGYYQAGGGWASYKEWMGDAAYKQFVTNLEQAIVTQIGQQKQKEHEAALKLQRAEKGEDMYQ
jgi:hypothetical protein